MAKAAELNWQRLPLEGACNVRDLGGYPVGIRQTKWHAFLRGDNLSHLTEDDEQFLYDYGVRTVIDLRSDEEVKHEPDQLVTRPDLSFIHVALGQTDYSDTEVLNELQKKALSQGFKIESVYDDIFDNTKALRAIFRSIAMEPEDTAILFHCNAGKDRSGIIAMLLLMLAGVSHEDCIGNYILSYSNIYESKEGKAELDRAPEEVHELVYLMQNTLGGYIYDTIEALGGARTFLEEKCNVSDKEVGRVKQRLL